LKGKPRFSEPRPPGQPGNDEVASKSQLKREAQAIKGLANHLLGLDDARLRQLPLENDVLEAIRQAGKISSHGARRRQLQYVARLLRREDPAAIIQAVEGFEAEARGLTARQHRCEAWRDRLVERGDPGLEDLLQSHPGLDVQALRQLIRNARREISLGRPPAAARALFRALRDLDGQSPLPPCA